MSTPTQRIFTTGEIVTWQGSRGTVSVRDNVPYVEFHGRNGKINPHRNPYRVEFLEKVARVEQEAPR